jgi:hypothetical protein
MDELLFDSYFEREILKSALYCSEAKVAVHKKIAAIFISTKWTTGKKQLKLLMKSRLISLYKFSCHPPVVYDYARILLFFPPNSCTINKQSLISNFNPN